MALEAVDDHVQANVAAINSSLCAHWAFPEIGWFTHIGHKLIENHRIAIGVKCSVDASDERVLGGAPPFVMTGPVEMLGTEVVRIPVLFRVLAMTGSKSWYFLLVTYIIQMIVILNQTGSFASHLNLLSVLSCSMNVPTIVWMRIQTIHSK